MSEYLFPEIIHGVEVNKEKPRRDGMRVSIYTDGAARGNPDGPGGYGTVLEYVDSKGSFM